jgi:hypothetical protein
MIVSVLSTLLYDARFLEDLHIQSTLVYLTLESKSHACILDTQVDTDRNMERL